MIAVSRRALRRFRAACARCTAGRARGPAPPVAIRQGGGRLTLTAAFPEVTLELACPARGPDDKVLIVPMSLLDEAGADDDEPLELEDGGGLSGTARWRDGGQPRVRPVELILPGRQHDPLPRPPSARPVPARLLAGLHEAGRTAAREDGRFALSRVQVRGAKGQVVATDGRLAVIFDHFPFPFTEDLLVPAIPLWGCPELRGEADVRVGRTAGHLAVSAGDWTAWLSCAPPGKFPDVAAVVPRSASTTVALDGGDVAALLARLAELPGRGHEHRPVTLDVGGVLAVRGYDQATGAVGGVTLARSPVGRRECRVAVDRRALARLLALGCRSLRLTPGKAVWALGENVAVLVAPLDPLLAAPAEAAAGAGGLTQAAIRDPEPEPERSTDMKTTETSGNPGGRRGPPRQEPPDPLAAAEELRQALGEAVAKAARREKKVLASVWAGLRQLNMPPENGGGA